MDERAIKRLLKILVVSIIAIMLLKAWLTKTYTTLNQAAAEKKQAAAVNRSASPPESTPPVAAEAIEMPAASSVGEPAAVELSASSGVSETERQ